MFRIRIGLNTDPDPALEVNTDPDPAFKVKTDPDPGFFRTTFYEIFAVENSQFTLQITIYTSVKDYQVQIKVCKPS